MWHKSFSQAAGLFIGETTCLLPSPMSRVRDPSFLGNRSQPASQPHTCIVSSQKGGARGARYLSVLWLPGLTGATVGTTATTAVSSTRGRASERASERDCCRIWIVSRHARSSFQMRQDQSLRPQPSRPKHRSSGNARLRRSKIAEREREREREKIRSKKIFPHA